MLFEISIVITLVTKAVVITAFLLNIKHQVQVNTKALERIEKFISIEYQNELAKIYEVLDKQNRRLTQIEENQGKLLTLESLIKEQETRSKIKDLSPRQRAIEKAKQ
jgi:hypothetical protein